MTENSVFFKLDKFQIMYVNTLFDMTLDLLLSYPVLRYQILGSGVEPHPSTPQIPLFCSHAVPRFIMPGYNHPQDTTKRCMKGRLL